MGGLYNVYIYFPNIYLCTLEINFVVHFVHQLTQLSYKISVITPYFYMYKHR